MPNRRRQWQDQIINAAVADGAQGFQVLLDGDIDDTKGMTLVRMVIGLNVIPVTFAGDSVDAQRVSLGIGTMSQEAISALTFPDPEIEGDHPLTGWMWRAQYIVLETPFNPGARVDLDLRSQRKVMYGAPTLVILNDPQQGTAFTIRVSGLIRCMYLLE